MRREKQLRIRLNDGEYRTIKDIYIKGKKEGLWKTYAQMLTVLSEPYRLHGRFVPAVQD